MLKTIGTIFILVLFVGMVGLSLWDLYTRDPEDDDLSWKTDM
jgi:hypothetical protein